MTSSLTRAGLTLAVALVLAIPVSGQGQQPSQSSAASQKAAKKVVPAPTAKASRDGGAMPQGFSIVLVLADLQAGPGEEDVPPAARKALLDMKDFLPYKSYRLLDAAWVLCCGQGSTVSRLRGPDNRDYEVELVASPAAASQTAVQFLLRDVDATRAVVASAARGAARSAQNPESTVILLEQQLAEMKTRLAPDHPEVVAQQKRLEEARASAAVARTEAGRAETARGRAGTAAGGQRRPGSGDTFNGPRAVMNTSFNMDLGETVVVGTSRLSGNSKALIALLTAVPSRPSRR